MERAVLRTAFVENCHRNNDKYLKDFECRISFFHLPGRKPSVSEKKQTRFTVPVPGHVVPDDHGKLEV